MALKGENSTNPTKNLFILPAKVKNVELAYNTTFIDKVYDVEAKITFECTKKDGGTYDKFMTLRGNYKKAEDSNFVDGWGNAIKLKIFFNDLGLTKWGTDDLGIIEQSVVFESIGKEVFLLQYRYTKQDGTLEYKLWDRVQKSEESLMKLWEKALASSYKPYNFTPIDSPDTIATTAPEYDIM